MITVVVQRLASLLRLATYLVLVAGLTLAVSAGGGCSPRALLELDVTGDSPFQSVKLRLTAGGTSKDFPNASFSAAMPYRAGLYVDSSGNIDVVANVLDGSGTCIGAGTASLSGIATGSASGATRLMVVHTTACASVTPGTGGSGAGSGGSGAGSGGATGAGGGGNGSGGSPGGTGGSGNGSGGSSGGMGGSGSGGSPGGTNLVMNGDFSNGSTSWGLPAMVGTVNQSVNAGQFCVTLVGTATIGYPSGGTAPFQINGGTPYTFSYQASSTGNLTIEAKVGQIQTPYDATGSDWTNEPVGASLQPFTHTFTRASTDSMMGVAFNLSGGPGTFCLDNVSLTAN